MKDTQSNLIKLVLKKLSCNQQELAKTLGVSPTQVSKWKYGEHMPYKTEEKLSKLAGIGSLHPDFVYWTGGIEQSKKWHKLISNLADLVSSLSETGFITWPLKEKENRTLLCWDTIYTLRQIGIEIPQKFPTELIFDELEELDKDDEIWEEHWERYCYRAYENPIYKLIHDSFMTLNNLYGFYAAYIDEIYTNTQEVELFEPIDQISCNLLSLAFIKTGEQSDFTPNYNKFRHETKKDFIKWIENLKNLAIQNSIPLRAELLDLVSKDEENLREQAEAESLGINSNRLHPDIYMNEILKSHRIIHQVLPVILKKLDIFDDFTLDDEPLNLGL